MPTAPRHPIAASPRGLQGWAAAELSPGMAQLPGAWPRGALRLGALHREASLREASHPVASLLEASLQAAFSSLEPSHPVASPLEAFHPAASRPAAWPLAAPPQVAALLREVARRVASGRQDRPGNGGRPASLQTRMGQRACAGVAGESAGAPGQNPPVARSTPVPAEDWAAGSVRGPLGVSPPRRGRKPGVGRGSVASRGLGCWREPVGPLSAWTARTQGRWSTARQSPGPTAGPGGEKGLPPGRPRAANPARHCTPQPGPGSPAVPSPRALHASQIHPRSSSPGIIQDFGFHIHRFRAAGTIGAALGRSIG
jgi:hypothetical protein